MAKNSQQETGMIMTLSYLVLFAVTALVVAVANVLFPESVVLGTAFLTTNWAILHSAGSVALLSMLAIPFFHLYERSRGRMLSSSEWMWGYFALNFAAIYIVTRFAEQFGMGVRSWLVVALLAAVLDVLQGAAMMWLESIRTKLNV